MSVASFEGRAVLVTGAGGFIGGHLVERLVRDGARVRGFHRYNSRDDRGTLDWIDPAVLEEVDVHTGDLRDIESVARAVRGTEVVFHLGAQVAVPYSFANPRDFVETNVLGSMNVARAVLDAGVQRMVHTSTSEVYGTAVVVPIDESHPLQAQSPYAASKIGADKIVESFCRTYDLPAVVLRPFNTFGPRQSARAVVPTIITQLLQGPRVKLGSVDPRRDLTFVHDTVAGFLAAAVADAAVGRTVQLGTGEAPSIGEIVELVGELVGVEPEVVTDAARVRPAKSEVGLLLSHPGLAAELLGWRPGTTLREGLAQTIEWISSHQHSYRTGEYVT
jgi:NAD dependent epimerase/dehydratase